MPLEEEKVLVTRGGKEQCSKGQTNAVSGMRGTIVSKSQTTMSPHFASPLCQEDEVCR